MGIFDIFRVGQIKAELLQVKRKRDKLKMAMRVVERMEAYNLKCVVDLLLARKQSVAKEIETALTGLAKQRRANEQ